MNRQEQPTSPTSRQSGHGGTGHLPLTCPGVTAGSLGTPGRSQQESSLLPSRGWLPHVSQLLGYESPLQRERPSGPLCNHKS